MQNKRSERQNKQPKKTICMIFITPAVSSNLTSLKRGKRWKNSISVKLFVALKTKAA
jgi:hypothetical protein